MSEPKRTVWYRVSGALYKPNGGDFVACLGKLRSIWRDMDLPEYGHMRFLMSTRRFKGATLLRIFRVDRWSTIYVLSVAWELDVFGNDVARTYLPGTFCDLIYRRYRKKFRKNELRLWVKPETRSE